MNNYLFESFESFVWMWFNMYSFNSLCEKDFHIFSDHLYLFLRGFNAGYLLFFNWTMYVLLVLSFFAWSLLSSSNIVNEILELFVSNSVGAMWMKF